MALSIYSLLMLFLITTRWKWNLGCFGAAVRTDSMRWNAFQEIPLKPVFVLIFRDTLGSNSLESGGIAIEERHIENTSKVCPSNPAKQMSLRGIAVMLLNHKLFLLKATFWQSKFLSSQAFWILNGPWAQTGARAVAPWHTFYSLNPQPLLLSVSPSVCPISSVSRFLKIPLQWLFLCLTCGLTGRFSAEGEHGDFTLHWGPLLTLLWGNLFSHLEFVSPHLQLGGVPGWRSGTNIR